MANLEDDGLSVLSSLAKTPKKGHATQEKVRICILEAESRDDYLPTLTVSLNNYHPYFEVHTAATYPDTLDILNSGLGFALAIVDLRLQGLDGFKLLARLFGDFPRLPLVVLLSRGDLSLRGKLDLLCDVGTISHPLDLNDLQNVINERLQKKNAQSGRTNYLGALLALLEAERKTTLMALSSGLQSGSCFVREGQIIDAMCGDKSGEAALSDLLAWNKPEVLFTDFDDRKIKNKINKSIFELASGQFPSPDKKVKKEQPPGEGTVEFSGNDPDKIIASHEVSNILRDEGRESRPKSVSHDVGSFVDPKNLKEELIMALESYLDRFKKINGYKASAIMNFTGEILAQDSNDPNIDLGMVGATFNDIFRTAHEASDKIGLEACREAAISTPKGIIIMRCSGVKSKVHYHTIAIFSADGNQALAKMEMEKMIPAVMEELA